MKPQRFSASAADWWILNQTGGRAGYFIDIGAVHHKDFSNTRLLEDHGWTGVCVDPDTRLIEARECGWVPRPITGRGGDRVDLKACRNRTCPEYQVTSLGISYLLILLEPPTIIDYISISARSQGLDILQGFPWDRYCVRFWTIEHSNEHEQTAAFQSIFRVQGCRMAFGVADFWAACGCDSSPTAPSISPVEGESSAGRPGTRGATSSRLAPDDASMGSQ
jgi:hypothetical protein